MRLINKSILYGLSKIWDSGLLMAKGLSPGATVLIGAIGLLPAGSMSAQISDCFSDAHQVICDSTLIGY